MVEAKEREHAMLFGTAIQVKFRDKKYPLPEASKLYVNSRTWRCESEKGSGDGDRLLGINSLGGHRPDPPTTGHLLSLTPFGCTTRYKLQHTLFI